jgi:hypothetical protein
MEVIAAPERRTGAVVVRAAFFRTLVFAAARGMVEVTHP